ncbi:MAG: adenylate kinase [Bacilli bacterium]|jgi:adenylate kinase
MHLIFLGPPGSGKGTQSSLISEKYGIPHISTGDMFRSAVRDETEAGLAAKHYMDQGLLVPDDVTIAVVKERLSKSDCQKGFLLDGFPRTLAQAEALEDILRDINLTIDLVLNLVLNESQLLFRIAGRRICKQCGTTFHETNHPPRVAGICDKCGGELYQRKDDNPDVMKTRIDAYLRQTSPLIQHYQQQNKLANIDAIRDMHVVFEEIDNLLRKL